MDFEQPVFESHAMVTTLLFDILALAEDKGFVSVNEVVTHPNFKPKNFPEEKIQKISNSLESLWCGWTLNQWKRVFLEPVHNNDDYYDFKLMLPRPVERKEVADICAVSASN